MALVGIYNENDFYSNHYLTSVFESDIRGVMDNWQQQETEAREHEKQQRLLGREPEQGFRAPHTQLNSYSGLFFKQLNEHGREKDLSTRLRQQRKRWKSILEPLGYQLKESSIELETGLFLPVLAHYQDTANNPFLWIVEAHDKFDEDNQDPLALALHKQQLPKDVLNDEALLKKQTGLLKTKNQTELSWQDLISKHILTQPEPPRWILLLGNRQALLIDRTKWAQNHFHPRLSLSNDILRLLIQLKWWWRCCQLVQDQNSKAEDHLPLPVPKEIYQDTFALQLAVLNYIQVKNY